MASSAKKARSEGEDTVVGYLHNLSPVKISKTNTCYFDATLQSGRDEYQRVVVFSPQKRQKLEQAAHARTPVKLTNVKRSLRYNDNSLDIVCGATAGVEVVESLPFFFRGPPPAGLMTIANVLNLGPRQHVTSVSVKILPHGVESRTAIVDGVPLELREFHVCDRSGQTKLTLWEDKIMMVDVSRSYKISNLTTKKFQNKTVLNSNPSTMIEEIEDVGEPDFLEQCDQSQDFYKVSGHVTGVLITSNHYCQKCQTSQEQFNKESASHRCEKCRMLQRVSRYNVLYNGKLEVEDTDGVEHKLTLTNSSVCTFISEYLGDAANNTEVIEDKLVSEDYVEVDVDPNQAVMSIKMSEQNAEGE